MTDHVLSIVPPIQLQQLSSHIQGYLHDKA